jgi:23S rRNA (adenine2503-C2)-methyltransferase
VQRHDLLGLDLPAFTAWSRALVGHAERFHYQLYRRMMDDGRLAPLEAPLWREAEHARPGVCATLQAQAACDQVPPITATLQAEDEQGTTTKVLCRLNDGAAVEAVLIPMHAGGHHTVCVSSQVGCKMGCSFCHTAKMGLVRNLQAHEIVAQVLAVRRATGKRPRNVVFMGMGEPLDNLEAVAQAVRVLTGPAGPAIAHRHITISTVGRLDGLARWRELGLERINLAVSLTAADDGLRSELMPVNRLYPLAHLKEVLHTIPIAEGRRILISCVVIPGVTDGPAHIRDLIAWLAGLPVLVNLIPYNPIPSRGWRAPTLGEVNAVVSQLDAAGIPVRLRLTKGEAVMAACGQLGDPARHKPVVAGPRS